MLLRALVHNPLQATNELIYLSRMSSMMLSVFLPSSDQVPESKSCFVWKDEDEEAQPVTEMELSSSPSFSDVSISR